MNEKRTVEKWKQGVILYTRRQLQEQGYRTRIIEPAGVLRCEKEGERPVFLERYWAERRQDLA